MKLTVKNRVRKLLIDKPHLRDSDQKLIANIWWNDVKAMGQSPNEITGAQLLHLYSEGRLTPAESIRRSRQKLQQMHPNLRGDRYEERQTEQVDETKQELKDMEKEAQS